MYISVHCSDSLLLQMLPFRIDSVDVGLNLVGCIVIGFSQFLTSLNNGGRKDGGGEGRGKERQGTASSKVLQLHTPLHVHYAS